MPRFAAGIAASWEAEVAWALGWGTVGALHAA